MPVSSAEAILLTWARIFYESPPLRISAGGHPCYLDIVVLKSWSGCHRFLLFVFCSEKQKNKKVYIAIKTKKRNLIFKHPKHYFGQAVVFLDRDDYKSTWLGNKSIYRMRMAIADGGELIVMAPGVTKFGEDPGIDALIRKVRLRSVHACIHRVTIDTMILILFNITAVLSEKKGEKKNSWSCRSSVDVLHGQKKGGSKMDSGPLSPRDFNLQKM